MRPLLIKPLVFLAFVLPLYCQTENAPTVDIARTFEWGQTVDETPGIKFSLRTRWSDGSAKYVATLTDTKGRVTKYFAKYRSGGDIPLSSFAVIFTDEEGFELYTLRFDDYTFHKQGDTANYVSTGEWIGKWKCDEKTYRALLKASATSWALEYPTELETSPLPRKK